MTIPFTPTRTSALDYFGLLVADDAQIPLLEAAALVASDDHPDLDPVAVLNRLDGLARRLRQRLASDASGAQKLRLLRHFFFAELGFSVNVNDFYNPENSHLHRVLETRRGIPITLALLFMEIGSQIGLRLSGISFPGHFLVKCSLSQGEVIVDPVDGRSLTREELSERLQPYLERQGLTGEYELPLGLFLQPARPRDVLARMLRNLKEIHRTSEDWQRLKPVMDRLVRVLPADPTERRDRGLVMAELEHWAEAADDLSLYLEQAPGSDDALAIAQRVDELRRLARPA